MALADLLNALESEADDEIARLDAESRHEAAGILDRARAEARQLEEELVRSQETELQSQAQRRRSLARLEAARSLREAREEGFREVLEGVRSRLSVLRDGPLYRSVLRELIRESRAALPAGRVVRIDPRDEALVAELLDELGEDLSVERTLRTWGGVELESADGRVLRNTLEERLANAEPLLRSSEEPEARAAYAAELEPGGIR